MNQTVNKTILDNGIRILTKKIPHVRSISMGVWVNVGARDEALTENGLSHCIEHMMFKGTKKRTAYQIAKEFDAIGGHTNAFTSMEHTCYHAKVLDTHLETMVDILSDIFLNPVFDASEVEKELPVILQEISMLEDSPEEYIHSLISYDFWGNHPLGRSILGNRENIILFDAATIENFFHKFYQPDRIVIAVTGNIDHDHLVALVGPSFEAIKPDNQIPERIKPVPQSKTSLTQKDLEQVHICLATNGLCITDPKRYALSLLNTMLGGNMSSQLFQEIREKRGLAYSVYSFISSHDDAGMLGVYAGVTADKAIETVELIIKEIKNLKQSKIDTSLLQDVKEYTKGNILLSAESTDNQMVRLAQNEIHFHKYVPLSYVIDKVESVTGDDIHQLTKQLFQPKQLSLSMLGPFSDNEKINDIINQF